MPKAYASRAIMANTIAQQNALISQLRTDLENAHRTNGGQTELKAQIDELTEQLFNATRDCTYYKERLDQMLNPPPKPEWIVKALKPDFIRLALAGRKPVIVGGKIECRA